MSNSNALSATWPVIGLLFLVFLVLFPAGPARADQSSFSEEEVSFESGHVTLHGTILVPEEASPGQKKRAITLVHGAGPGPREESRLEAEAFARGGIVTLIYDKRTKGYSGFDRSYELLASDALAAVNAFCKTFLT